FRISLRDAPPLQRAPERLLSIYRFCDDRQCNSWFTACQKPTRQSEPLALAPGSIPSVQPGQLTRRRPPLSPADGAKCGRRRYRRRGIEITGRLGRVAQGEPKIRRDPRQYWSTPDH